MAQQWVPTAYWMTNKDNIPRHHPSRFSAITYARSHKVPAFRQDVNTGVITLIYEPITDTEYQAAKSIKVGVS